MTNARTIPMRRGFSLIEATISIVIVSLMLVTSLSLVGATTRGRQLQSSQAHGRHLAHELMGEILQLPYADPTKGVDTPIGLDDGESSDVRTGWDDLDDYDGLQNSPPEQRNGAPMSEFEGWTRSVEVSFARPGNPDVDTAANANQGLKRITVTVTDSIGRTSTVTALRSSAGIIDQPVDVPETVFGWMGVDLQFGPSEDSLVRSGTVVLNAPAAVGPNLLTNPGFETGLTAWETYDNSQLIAENSSARSGAVRLRVQNRYYASSGPAQNITGLIKSGSTYEASIWVKVLDEDDEDQFRVVMYVKTNTEEITSTTGSAWVSTGWTELKGSFKPTFTGTPTEILFRVESVYGSYPYRADDAVLREVQ